MSNLDNLANIVSAKSILTGLESEDRPAVIKALIQSLVASKQISKGQIPAVGRGIKERESLGTTAIGGGVAIPHGRVSFVDKVLFAFALLSEGTGFQALDGAPVKYVFMALSPKSDDVVHTQILKLITTFTQEPIHLKALSGCTSAKDVIGVFKDYS